VGGDKKCFLSLRQTALRSAEGKKALHHLTIYFFVKRLHVFFLEIIVIVSKSEILNITFDITLLFSVLWGACARWWQRSWRGL
jgi:hypothetical protein